MKKKPYIWLIIFLILLGIVKVISINWLDSTQNTITPVSASLCDVYRSCTLPNGASIELSGQSAKLPMNITLSHAPKNTEQVYISFSMQDMDMGFNRYKLIAQPNDKTTWYAKNIRLPACVQNRHDYLMDITMGDKTYQIAFIAK